MQDQQPKPARVVAEWVPAHLQLSNHQISPVLSNCEDSGPLTASAPQLLWPPLFKAQGSGIPCAQRKEEGSRKNWAAMHGGECRPWLPPPRATL